jgi:hypothetical protein
VPGKAQVVAAVRLAGEYLLRVQKPDGSFRYWYDPLQDRFSSRSYNILRHAGTTASLFELYSFTRDARYLEAARKGIAYLSLRFRRVRPSGLYVLDNDGKAKLGANGLALIALVKDLELERNKRKLEQARALARTIIDLQQSDGAFASYYRIRGDEPAGDVSLYYPGEAILGLVGLYNLNRDQRLLQSARRGADYLVKSERAAPKLPPDAWLIQALEPLYEITRESVYAEHAMALAESMIADQYDDTDGGEYEGGFGPGEPRGTPAASRAEGLVSAYRLATRIGHPAKDRIALALLASTRFQLSQQYTPASSGSLRIPATAYGGFRESLSSPRIRIDFVQHNISSLIGIARSVDELRLR